MKRSEQLHQMSLFLQFHASRLRLLSLVTRVLGDHEAANISYQNEWIHLLNEIYMPPAVTPSTIPLPIGRTTHVPALPSHLEQSTHKKHSTKTPHIDWLTDSEAEAVKKNVYVLVRGWSIKALAKAMGQQVAPSTVYRIWRDKAPRDDTRTKLASALSQRYSAHFTFEDLLDPAFDLNNFRLRTETLDQA